MTGALGQVGSSDGSRLVTSARTRLPGVNVTAIEFGDFIDIPFPLIDMCSIVSELPLAGLIAMLAGASRAISAIPCSSTPRTFRKLAISGSLVRSPSM